MNKYKKEDSFFKNTDGFVKQLLLSVGLGIVLLVFMLFASGIFFTGAVVQSINSVTSDSSYK